MRIVIYNSSSFGGCFDYGRALFPVYQQHPEIEKVSWWIPENSNITHRQGIDKPFIGDKPGFKNRFMKQAHFFIRTLLNPLILFGKLWIEPPSVVIFNDFEQLSAVVWVPLFGLFLKRKHHFAIILHDPDRDAYPPSLWLSQWSMRKIMDLMDVAIYHDFLPDKPYYQLNKNCLFLDLPHGFYPMPGPDPELFNQLSAYESAETTIMTILGNIREEKNYHLAIQSLVQLPCHILIIAGSVSNTRVNVGQYKDLAKKFGVENRIIWIEKFMTEAEMVAVIEISDVILLNYAVSFTSQSGILNIVAPFRKELIVSDGQSSLASIIRKFKVGELVKPSSVDSLVHGLKRLENEEVEIRQHWEDYMNYASWEKHVDKAVNTYKALPGR